MGQPSTESSDYFSMVENSSGASQAESDISLVEFQLKVNKIWLISL